ncbi:MAG: hypothetical protein ACPGJS_13515 [Flammeovirgaceae bacterium]
MLRRPRILKAIALFLTVNMLNYLFMPTVAYALTAGPTAPEYTSFEPIDTSTMVNYNTGDLVYNLPLLQVPGPEGGYPLNLSYHAGIQPNVESSWVGLGWSLNVGAINRVVDFFPDDVNQANYTVTENWAGGQTDIFTFGIPLGGGASVRASISNDTYKGVGVESISASVAGFSADTRGNVGIKGFSFNVYNGAASYSTGWGPISSTFDLNSKKIKFNASFGSITMPTLTNKVGKMRMESGGINLGLLSHQYRRYWIHEVTNTDIYGIANISNTVGSSILNNGLLDSYALPDIDVDLVDHPDVEKNLGGSLPAYDTYHVSGNGVGGAIRPFMRTNASLFRKKTDELEFVRHKTSPTAERPSFRFLNDFSNSFKASDIVNFEIDNNGNIVYDIDIRSGIYSVKGLGYQHNVENTEGFDRGRLRLAGSKHVAHFFNQEIAEGEAHKIVNPDIVNFLDYAGEAVDRSTFKGYDISKQIGGFAITNETGLTHHYALPVYTYDNFQHSAVPADLLGLPSNSPDYSKQIDNKHPHAYTWLLTTVTGPDFVDVNNNGIADEGDLGYWVNFEYGKWTDEYQYRTPHEGTNTDISNTKAYAYGKKELYYLDAVKTRTHTALFIKEMKHDGKGVWGKQGGIGYREPEVEDICEYGDNDCRPGEDYVIASPAKLSVSALKLNKIVLLKNDQLQTALATQSLADLKAAKNVSPEDIFLFEDTPGSSLYPVSALVQAKQYKKNVLDVEDLTGSFGATLMSKSIKSSIFDTDYSLAVGTANSMVLDYDALVTSTPRLGKLTLKAVRTAGKGGVEGLLPPMRFSYEVPNPISTTGTISIAGLEEQAYLTTNQAVSLEVGDILTYNRGGNAYYVLVQARMSDTNFRVHLMNENLVTQGQIHSGVSLTQTNNPPYNKDAYDLWNLYKADYIDDTANENLTRLTSEASAKAAKAWSLHTIETNLGAKIQINYESDTYTKPVLHKTYQLNVKDMVPVSGSTDLVEITFHNKYSDLNDILKIDSDIDLVSMLRYVFKSTTVSYCSGDGTSYGATYETVPFQQSDFEIDQIQSQKLVVKSAKLFEKLNTIPAGMYVHPNETCVDGNGRRPIFVTFTQKPTVDGGNMFFNTPSLTYGGGLRVSKIEMVDPITSKKVNTYYSYEKGTTSFEPSTLDKDILATYSVDNYNTQTDAGKQRFHEARDAYHKILYNSFSDLLALSRMLPAPGVTYQKVAVAASVTDVNGNEHVEAGKIVYEYQTFEEDMFIRNKLHEDKSVDGKKHVKTLQYHDRSAQIGSLLSVTNYDKYGQPVSKTVNTYTTDGEGFNNQGMLDEVYHEHRKLLDTDEEKAIVTIRSNYPNILTKTTNIDYTTGSETAQENLAFDFYTGMVTHQKATDAYGNEFLSVSVPAYQLKKSDGTKVYPAMGLKLGSELIGGVDEANNNHMLGAIAANYSYKLDEVNGNLLLDLPFGQRKGNLLAAAVQTWTNQVDKRERNASTWQTTVDAPINHWRKDMSYSWTYPTARKDGTSPTFVPFNWDNIDAQNENWKESVVASLYNKHGHIVESRNINGNFGAIKMGYDQSKTLANVVNARFTEFAYAGVEDDMVDASYFSGEVKKNNGVIGFGSNAHTGNAVLILYGTVTGFSFTVKESEMDTDKLPRWYRASVWVKPTGTNIADAMIKVNKNNVNVASASGQLNSQKQVNGWYQLNLDFQMTAGGDYTISCENVGGSVIYLDDFRVHPMDAQMISYVYDDQTDELIYILDSHNMFTKYEYDEMGKLKAIYKETFKYGIQKLSEHEYQMSRDNN